MTVNFETSRTKENLMRAFAGESQARNRYTFAASAAKTEGYPLIASVFLFTADQEKEHAEIFWKYLAPLSCRNISIEGGYPACHPAGVSGWLRAAQHDEYEEYRIVYPEFAEVAEGEGFPEIAAHFRMIAGIEGVHGDRFGYLADLLDEGKLFSGAGTTRFLCLNCGHIHEGPEAPEKCPVCAHEKGYFIRMDMAPYTTSDMGKR